MLSLVPKATFMPLTNVIARTKRISVVSEKNIKVFETP
jgi:hypothetical protein